MLAWTKKNKKKGRGALFEATIWPKRAPWKSLLWDADNYQNWKVGNDQFHIDIFGGQLTGLLLYHVWLGRFVFFYHARDWLTRPWQTMITPDPSRVIVVCQVQGMSTCLSCDWVNLLWLRQIYLVVRQTRQKRVHKKRVHNTPQVAT